jgi:hypothetical protein
MYGIENLIVNLMKELFPFFVLYSIIRFIIYFYKLQIMSHWGLLLDMQFSTKEFFERLKQRLIDSGVSDISYTQLELSERVIGISKRTYLTINYKDYVFYICGAPFGNYFFTSYWTHFKPNILEIILRSIPIIGNPLANIGYSLTYYEYDQSASFRTLLHHHITELIKEMTTEKGVPMPEIPKPIMNDVFKR